MPEEKTEEKAVETTTTSAPEPARELETLKSQLAEKERLIADKESALAEATERARKHEQAATRNANKLQEQQKRLSEITTLKEEIGVMREAIFDLLDSGTSPEEQPKTRRSEQYREKLRTQPKTEEPQYPTDFVEKAQEAEELARSVGLDMAKSKELRAARMAFRDFDADDGLEEVKKVVELKKQPPKVEVRPVEEKPKPYQPSEKEEEEIARKYMEKKGLLTTDTNLTGGGSGGLQGLTSAKLKDRMKQPDGLEWFRKNEAEIDRLHGEGKIK